MNPVGIGSVLRSGFEAGFLALAAMADAAIFLLVFIGEHSMTWAVLAHIVVASASWPVCARANDCTNAALAVLSILVMGPVGALGTLILLYGVRRSPGSEPARMVPGHRAAGAAAAGSYRGLVEEGRAFCPASSRVIRFATIMATGTVMHKQAVLGIIAQRFHPDYMPHLRAGLTSPELAVRASAAAVFAKLREGERAHFVRWLSGHDHGAGRLPDPIVQAKGLARAARTGFLDPREAAHARQQALTLILKVRPEAERADATEELLCTLMAEEDRFEDLAVRLERIASPLSPRLEQLLARARMRTGRRDRFARPLAMDREQAPMALPDVGAARPLLALTSEATA